MGPAHSVDPLGPGPSRRVQQDKPHKRDTKTGTKPVKVMTKITAANLALCSQSCGLLQAVMPKLQAKNLFAFAHVSLVVCMFWGCRMLSRC